jgi:hypothetical protein
VGTSERTAAWPALRRTAAAFAGDAPRRAALSDVWRALWSSRLLVWAAGVYGILTVGFRPHLVIAHDLAPFGALGNVLVGPAARWDAGWYVSIAQHPYDSAPQAAFFPLYPLGIRALAVVVGSPLISGILIAVVAFAVALYLLHRLTALEFGPDHARTAVLALAFFPTALFFSAVYSESLLLALSIGAVYAARRGRWAWAGVLGALASATRNTGVLIALPLAILYLYGPREDRPGTGAEPARRSWRPAHPLRANALWLALVPVGLGGFLAYMGIAHGDALLPLHANETYWYRHFGLLTAIPKGAAAFWNSLEVIGRAPGGELFDATNGPLRYAAGNLVDFWFLIFAVAATVGVLRRLPLAYGAYCVASLIMILSAPHVREPLASLPRYVAVLFPVQMWLAVWVADRRGRPLVWLGASALVLGAFSSQFATWRWVA